MIVAHAGGGLGCLGEARRQTPFLEDTHTPLLATPRTCYQPDAGLYLRISLEYFYPRLHSCALPCRIPHACRSPACRKPPLTAGAAPCVA